MTLQRTGFKRPVFVRPAPSRPAPATRRSSMALAPGPAPAREKENVVRSEKYRRLVAALPCMWCGLDGYSQAAHPPPSGKGIKEDDRLCVPLCCDRPGVPGCHWRLDQFRLMPKKQAIAWVKTMAFFVRSHITQAGAWPRDLPPMEKQEETHR